jgi:PncC family amidohydrolase
MDDESPTDADLAVAAERVVALLRSLGLTLALGESCTGGLIGDLITDVSGSSRVLQGGIVAYANAAKERLLGVPLETMLEHGSVSEETALAMASSARERLEADVGLAATGIAGPGGGTAEKPVGLACIAAVLANGDSVTKRVVWDGGRRQNKRQTALLALLLIEELLRVTDN